MPRKTQNPQNQEMSFQTPHGIKNKNYGGGGIRVYGTWDRPISGELDSHL